MSCEVWVVETETSKNFREIDLLSETITKGKINKLYRS